MARNEEIVEYSMSFKGKGMENEELKEIIRLAIIDGAKWADENPSEENLTAYLSKRGWPVSADGKVLSYGQAIKLCETSLNYDKQKWGEQACEFLKDRIEHDSIEYPMATMHLIDDFKNYMNLGKNKKISIKENKA